MVQEYDSTNVTSTLANVLIKSDYVSDKSVLKFGKFGRRISASAEVLALFLLHNKHLCEGKDIIELGSGNPNITLIALIRITISSLYIYI